MESLTFLPLRHAVVRCVIEKVLNIISAHFTSLLQVLRAWQIGAICQRRVLEQVCVSDEMLVAVEMEVKVVLSKQRQKNVVDTGVVG